MGAVHAQQLQKIMINIIQKCTPIISVVGAGLPRGGGGIKVVVSGDKVRRLSTLQAVDTKY